MEVPPPPQTMYALPRRRMKHYIIIIHTDEFIYPFVRLPAVYIMISASSTII